MAFYFVCGFGCDCGLWLKWWFAGCAGGGLVAGVVVAMGCVGFGCNSGLWLWMYWHMEVVAGVKDIFYFIIF